MFKFGSAVFYADLQPGQRGTLRGLVSHPRTGQITDLVVGKGTLQAGDHIIPIDLVERVEGHHIFLSINSWETTQYPEYRLEPVHPKARRPVKPALGPGQLLLGPKTRVCYARKIIGFVDEIVIDQKTHRLTHLVIRQGRFPHRLIVPARVIQLLTHSRVEISMSLQDLEELNTRVPTTRPTVVARWNNLLAGLSRLNLFLTRQVKGHRPRRLLAIERE